MVVFLILISPKMDQSDLSLVKFYISFPLSSQISRIFDGLKLVSYSGLAVYFYFQIANYLLKLTKFLFYFFSCTELIKRSCSFDVWSLLFSKRSFFKMETAKFCDRKRFKPFRKIIFLIKVINFLDKFGFFGI